MAVDDRQPVLFAPIQKHIVRQLVELLAVDDFIALHLDLAVIGQTNLGGIVRQQIMLVQGRNKLPRGLVLPVIGPAEFQRTVSQFSRRAIIVEKLALTLVGQRPRFLVHAEDELLFFRILHEDERVATDIGRNIEAPGPDIVGANKRIGPRAQATDNHRQRRFCRRENDRIVACRNGEFDDVYRDRIGVCRETHIHVLDQPRLGVTGRLYRAWRLVEQRKPWRFR